MKKKVFSLLSALVLLGGAAVWLVASVYIATQQPEVRAAMDIGSGATNLKVAKVDRATNKIVQILFERSIPVAYQKQLEQSASGSFDRQVMDQGIKAIKALKADADEYGVKKVVAVATAAFRQAQNSKGFVQEIAQQTGVELKIISQDEEGLMAFRAALATTPADPARTVVWDIGGGSLQMTAQDDKGVLIVAKGSTASASFKNYIIEKIEGRSLASTQSPNPMSAAQMGKAIQYAVFLANSSITDRVKDKLKEKEINVLAVGNLFNHGIRSFVYPSSKERTLSKAQLLQTVYQKEGMSDVQLASDSFAEVAISNPLLVIGFMEALGIEQVTVLDVNNADGALTYPPFWLSLNR